MCYYVTGPFICGLLDTFGGIAMVKFCFVFWFIYLLFFSLFLQFTSYISQELETVGSCSVLPPWCIIIQLWIVKMKTNLFEMWKEILRFQISCWTLSLQYFIYLFSCFLLFCWSLIFILNLALNVNDKYLGALLGKVDSSTMVTRKLRVYHRGEGGAGNHTGMLWFFSLRLGLHFSLVRSHLNGYFIAKC